jgi:PAS domain S-box-containing protein
MTARRPSPIEVYVAALGIAVTVLVIVSAAAWTGVEPLRWLSFTVLFGIAEYVDIFFHHERGRQSLNPSEAILLPMIVVLPIEQVVLGVFAAMVTIRIVHWREGALRFVFNVAQYSIAAGVASLVWTELGTRSGELSPLDALVAMLGVFVFDAISHVLTAGAIAISERTNMMAVLRSVTATAGLYLTGNALVGLLLAAAYLQATWTLALFPLMLLMLRIASRALLRQARERERSEHLHTAARALVAGVSLESAISGFLSAVVEVMSAVEALAITDGIEGMTAYRAKRGEPARGAAPVHDKGLRRLFETVASGDPLVVTASGDAPVEPFESIDARSFVAVKLVESDEVVGALVAIDRVGTDDFGASDARLLEALGHELVLSLTSFHLIEEVVQERERFQRIFRSSREGIALIDSDGVVRAWNPALARMAGIGEDSILGSRWSERIALIDEDHRYIERDRLAELSPEETLELVRPDGSSRWVSVLPGPVLAGEGRGWVVIVRDVTAEHELEQTREDFIATISHELRTPLTGIKGSLDVLRRRGPALPPGRLEQLIDMTSWGAERLETLVGNLLIVSDIAAGDMPLHIGDVELRDLVAERVGTSLKGHRLIDLSLPDDDVMVAADRQWLGRALDHVLDNARKFGGERGRIMIDVRVDGADAEIAVGDEGPGIPIEERERIFGRFVRLGDVMTRETQGAGIGLHIARRSVEAMGGTISVDDEDGDTTFRIRFPLRTVESSVAPAEEEVGQTG